MVTLAIITHSALYQTQHNTWQRGPYSASLIALRLITAFRWRTNGPLKSLLSILPAELLPYRRLAQRLSRSVSAFSSFMREYLEPIVKINQCAQYVDDFETVANNATDLTQNKRAVFQCIHKAGLKLTKEKCHFAVRQNEFLGKTISSEGVSPQTYKIQNFPNKLRFPKTKKTLQRYLGFAKYYGRYFLRMADTLNQFNKLLKTEVPINITSELTENFNSVNKTLKDACQLALKQHIPGKRPIQMTDGKFRSADYALKNEDNPDQNIQSKRKTYAPVAFGSNNFSPAQIKKSNYSKEYLAIYMLFSRVWTQSVGSIKTNNCLNRQWINHPFLPDKSSSTIFVERMRSSAAVQFQNSTFRWFSQHSNWLFLQTRTESHGEDLPQNPGGCTNNAHWGHKILLRCCKWRAILLHTDRWWRRDWKTNPWRKRAITEKGNRMGSTKGTIFNEAKYQIFHKGWRKPYVVHHTRNQSKCTDTSRTRCRSSLEKVKTQKVWPATWRSAIHNRQTV